MSEKYESILEAQRRRVVEFVRRCADESEQDEKLPRRPQNTKNWQYFHGNIDWSHKDESDPVIHLHKVGVAAERIRSKFKSSMMNYDRWLSVEREYGDDLNSALPSFAARSLLFKQFDNACVATRISDAILNASIESRMTLKVSGKYVTKPRYVPKDGDLVKEEKKIWQLDLPVLSFEKFKPDPKDADAPLYKIEEFRLDAYRVMAMASEEQSADKPLRLEAVKKLDNFAERTQDMATKQAEGSLVKMDRTRERKQVLIQNFFGTILDEDGSVFEWEESDGSKVPLENILCVVGNEKELLLDPSRNTRWSDRAPYIYIDLLRSPGTGRKALLDAGTDINHAENELFSLMLAGAIKSVHNNTWSRPGWIANKDVLTGGIKPGDNFEVNDSAPINGVPFGTVKTGEIPQEAMVMKQMLDTVFAENVISNRLDLSGDMGDKSALATQIVSAKSAISDVFDSLSMDIEKDFIVPLAEECLLETIQHIDEMDADEVRSCFGLMKDKAEEFLKMSPKQRAAACLGRFKFKGRGLKGIIANMNHAQALINLLNTMAANPLMQQALESQVSAPKIFLHVADLMAIDKEKIMPDQQERNLIDQKQLIREQAISQAQMMQGAPAGPPAGGGSPAQPGSGMPGQQTGNGQGGF